MNTIYENEIIENKMTDLLNTRLDARALMTVDTSLTESAGLRKVINRYTYKGSVENLQKGEKNTVKGSVSFVPEYYDVKRYQQTFEYNDMDAMADPYIVDVAMQGAVTEIANEINREYIDEILKVSTKFTYDEVITYNDFVDALAKIDCEVEPDLFIIMGADIRKDIRKDPDFVTAKQGEIIYSGQFGTICGIPVLFSKLLPKDRVVITGKDAVRFFVKKSASVEQARDIETKDNTVVYERHGLIALVDDTRSVLIGRAPNKFNWQYDEQPNFETVQIQPLAYAPSEICDYYYKFERVDFFDGDVVDLSDGWVKLDKSTFEIPKKTKGEVITIIEAMSDTGVVSGYEQYTYTKD